MPHAQDRHVLAKVLDGSRNSLEQHKAVLLEKVHNIPLDVQNLEVNRLLVTKNAVLHQQMTNSTLLSSRTNCKPVQDPALEAQDVLFPGALDALEDLEGALETRGSDRETRSVDEERGDVDLGECVWVLPH